MTKEKSLYMVCYIIKDGEETYHKKCSINKTMTLSELPIDTEFIIKLEEEECY